jgi:hypothetical protein
MSTVTIGFPERGAANVNSGLVKGWFAEDEVAELKKAL